MVSENHIRDEAGVGDEPVAFCGMLVKRQHVRHYQPLDSKTIVSRTMRVKAPKRTQAAKSTPEELQDAGRDRARLLEMQEVTDAREDLPLEALGEHRVHPLAEIRRHAAVLRAVQV